MSEARHTPGPWTVVTEKSAEGGSFSIMHTGLYVADTVGGLADGEAGDAIEKANAHLIAAAPDLLAACKAAKRLLEPDLVEPGRTVFWALVAAIRKAEGHE